MIKAKTYNSAQTDLSLATELGEEAIITGMSAVSTGAGNVTATISLNAATDRVQRFLVAATGGVPVIDLFMHPHPIRTGPNQDMLFDLAIGVSGYATVFYTTSNEVGPPLL